MITATQFFFNLGNNDRLTLEASKPIHEAWLKATPEQRTQLRTDCMAHYIMGNMKCDRKESDRILSQSRTERTKAAQKAYRTANERFTYHVSRENKKVKTNAPTHYRITPAYRALAMDFLGEFEGETLDEQIKAAGFTAAQDAAPTAKRGLRFTKLIPPGCG